MWKLETCLHVVISVEGLATNRARELCWANENLRRSGDPIRTDLVEPVDGISGGRIITISMIFISDLWGRSRENRSHLSSTRARQSYVECDSDSRRLVIITIIIIFFCNLLADHHLVDIHGSTSTTTTTPPILLSILLLMFLFCGAQGEEGESFLEGRGGGRGLVVDEEVVSKRRWRRVGRRVWVWRWVMVDRVEFEETCEEIWVGVSHGGKIKAKEWEEDQFGWWWDCFYRRWVKGVARGAWRVGSSELIYATEK